MPSACAAMPMRPPSSVAAANVAIQERKGGGVRREVREWERGDRQPQTHTHSHTYIHANTHTHQPIAILKPMPGSPSMFSFGTRQPSKMRLHVDEARMPSWKCQHACTHAVMG